jgi:cellulose biosynthesis protein BcsQ
VRIIAVVNQKGGSGKTTTAINLAAVYARRGLRTLLVDFDPQAHCSAGLGVPDNQIEMSVGEALLADLGPGFDPSPLLWEVARNFHLAPSTMRLAALESPNGGLYQLPDRDRRLAGLLRILGPRFDRCIIDCPPTIGMLTYNALRAAREALIPVETGFFSLRGAEKQWTTICRLIERLDRPIACHILPTIHRPGSRLACEILASLRKRFAGQIIPMEIEEHDELRESASFGQPVMEYAPNSLAHQQFEQLVDWLEDHMPTTGVEIEIVPQAESWRGGSSTNGVWRERDESASAPADVFNEPCAVPARSGGGRPQVSDFVRPVGARAAEMALKVRSLLQARGEVARETVRETLGSPIVAAPQREQAAPERVAQGATAPQPPMQSQPIVRRSCVVLETSETSRALPTAPPAAAGACDAAQPCTTSTPAASTTTAPGSIESVYGVRAVSEGVLFVQPGSVGSRVCIAGEFNGWSAEATPLRFDPVLKVHHAIVHIAEGRHRYRLVVDGRWINDQYNSHSEHNEFGELNSVLEATSRRRES